MRISIGKLKKMKQEGKKILALTAYDSIFAQLFDESMHLLLIGDSLNMIVKGEQDTLGTTVDEIIYHTKAVVKATKNAFILADMPFGSYYDEQTALINALKIIKLSGASAVKIELDMDKIPLLKRLCDEGIPVMAHIGLKPQFVRFEGGYKIAGKNEDAKKHLLSLAKACQEAGAFALLLEGIKADVATQISINSSIPTIGIGSGNQTDGQILVYSDALGFYDDFVPKFVRKFMQGKQLVKEALNAYALAVEEKSFPNEDESY